MYSYFRVIQISALWRTNSLELFDETDWSSYCGANSMMNCHRISSSIVRLSLSVFLSHCYCCSLFTPHSTSSFSPASEFDSIRFDSFCSLGFCSNFMFVSILAAASPWFAYVRFGSARRCSACLALLFAGGRLARETERDRDTILKLDQRRRRRRRRRRRLATIRLCFCVCRLCVGRPEFAHKRRGTQAPLDGGKQKRRIA